MIGDILFYRMHQPSLGDELITLYEGNQQDFVHVAIQISDTRKVEAVYNNGVVINNLNNARVDATYSPGVKSVKKGLDWLQQQVGQDYGYGDIADIILRHPVFECHYDCSALASTYLITLKDKKYTYEGSAHMVTPQMLADMLGVK